MVQFGNLDEHGNVSNVRIISASALMSCPHIIMVPEHYDASDHCRCTDPDHTEMIEWGYTWDGERWVG